MQASQKWFLLQKKEKRKRKKKQIQNRFVISCEIFWKKRIAYIQAPFREEQNI